MNGRSASARGAKKGRLIVVLAARAGWAAAATNLVFNGGFDHPDGPLLGWKHDYRDTGNRHYARNHEYVSVAARDGERRQVLRLHGTRARLWGSGQGVMVDSKPVPFEPGTKYRLSVAGRTTGGPNCRVYIEGYRWRPGIKPHADPGHHELVKIYRQGSGRILYFGDRKHGPFSNPSTGWRTGVCLFPGDDPSALAAKHLARVQFMCVHVIAIDGWDGDILIDDVVLEKVKPAPGADK